MAKTTTWDRTAPKRVVFNTIGSSGSGLARIVDCHSMIDNIRRRQFSFSVSTTGRAFNAITGIKRELRRALSLAGQTMGSVGICNAQPALLAMMIDQQYHAAEEKGRETGRKLHMATVPAPHWPTPDCGVTGGNLIPS